MLTKDQYDLYCKKALDLYQKANIVLTETEKQQVEMPILAWANLARLDWQ
jgi:hypothetical protein